jgi:hypothetical protein
MLQGLWEAPFSSRRNIALTILAGSSLLWVYNKSEQQQQQQQQRDTAELLAVAAVAAAVAPLQTIAAAAAISAAVAKPPVQHIKPLAHITRLNSCWWCCSEGSCSRRGHWSWLPGATPTMQPALHFAMVSPTSLPAAITCQLRVSCDPTCTLCKHTSPPPVVIPCSPCPPPVPCV